jgi:hypothetical protein
MMINVNGERKHPLGEVLKFLITIKGVTIPIDMVVVDANSYSAIVGNDWLSKVKAQIDYVTCTMIITWNGKDIEVPVEYRYMPHEKSPVRIPEPVEEVEESSEDEDEAEADEDEYKEEYEEEDLDEISSAIFNSYHPMIHLKRKNPWC